MNHRQHGFVVLDLLRGLAAFLVFFGHIRQSSFVEFGALPPEQHSVVIAVFFAITRLGHEAVMIFFTISGFLVFGQILKRLETGVFDMRRYVIDRTTRIFVPLIPACLLTALIGGAFNGIPVDYYRLATAISGLNGVIGKTLANNAPLWTLAYEVWFYVLAGALAYAWKSQFCSKAAIGFLGISISVFSILDAKYLMFWLAAGLFAWLPERPVDHKRRILYVVCTLSLIALGVTLYQLGSLSNSFTNPIIAPPGFAEFLICVGSALFLRQMCAQSVNRQLQWVEPIAKRLSEFSFSLYLVHYPVNTAMDTLFPRAPTVDMQSFGYFGARVVVCLVVVLFFYAVFERNTNAIRQWINSNPHSAA